MRRIFFFVLSLLCVPLHASAAQPITLAGKFGFLGEYELSARLAEGADGYAGPLIVRHVGLCSHDGPQEMSGEISLKRGKTGGPVSAVLTFNGRRCTYNGTLSESAGGELACPGAAVPASLWPREQ